MNFQIKMKWIQGLTLIVVSITGLQSWAGDTSDASSKGAVCRRDAAAVSERSYRSETVAVGDLAEFRAAKPLVDGGVIQFPVVDQGPKEDCWSYALNRLVDFGYFQISKTPNQDPSTMTLTSADHNSYWHNYFQISEHETYFHKLAAKVKSNKMTMEEATTEAVKMFHSLSMSGTAREAEFTVDPGNDQPTALKEAKVIGFVPLANYDTPLKSQAEANSVTNALKLVVETIIADENRAAYFANKDKYGISTALYNLLNEKLGSHIRSASANGHLPYRPDDTFLVNGVATTPVQYMNQVLKFDPDAWVNVGLTDENKELMFEAIRDAIDREPNQRIPIIMGFVVFNQLQGEKDMVWSMDMLDDVKVELDGGHAVIVDNGMMGAIKVVGQVFDNSWGGKQGLTINGKPPKAGQLAGYNGITNPYHEFTIQQKNGSEFVFPISFLKNPKYQKLIDDAASQAAAQRHHPGRAPRHP